MIARFGSAAALATVALLIAGCGSSHSHAAPGGSSATGSGTTPGPGTPPSSGPLMVTPANPATTDPITFAFTAPAATGVQGKDRISYSVSITGPSGNGCVGAKEATISQAGKGGTASATVGPQQLGGQPWCAGAYTARAFELESAACTGSAPCPQFIRVVGIVARASFSVRSG
jgi:hypothetical protein